ncbi:uncharacterized protein LOC115449545 [Manduca sexta]|uniref:uncharacterized protein LOC115449545 n=1 Tax=Manduca sexta TaxID=7130 RepID=UPI00188F9524|nr:uncharacterized protein LOC115449545 [Manduca sexta]
MFFAVLCLVLLGTVAAHTWEQDSYPDEQNQYNAPSLNRNFDKFWNEFNRSMDKFDRGIAKLQREIEKLWRKMPHTGKNIEVTDNRYALKMYFNVNFRDIEVKSKPGTLMINAIYKDKDGRDKNYSDELSLPDNVDPAGKWTYSQGVLKIDFKKKNGPENPVVISDSVVDVDNDLNEYDVEYE